MTYEFVETTEQGYPVLKFVYLGRDVTIYKHLVKINHLVKYNAVFLDGDFDGEVDPIETDDPYTPLTCHTNDPEIVARVRKFVGVTEDNEHIYRND